MMPAKLRPRQEKMLAYIRSFTRRRGYSPSIREIGDACAISSTSVVTYNLKGLEHQGLITRNGPSRSIAVVEVRRHEMGGCPFCGCPVNGAHE